MLNRCDSKRKICMEVNHLVTRTQKSKEQTIKQKKKKRQANEQTKTKEQTCIHTSKQKETNKHTNKQPNIQINKKSKPIKTDILN